jgi:hypothetical protein
VVIASLLFVAPTTLTDSPGPGYVTIQFGRTQWTTGKKCVPLPKAVDLGVVADAMAARGLVGTGAVVLNRTPETGLFCFHGYALHVGWDWMHRMQEERGWSFISQSRTYTQLPTLSYDQQVAESCGSLGDFTAHDIQHADALFAYPANKSTAAIQSDPVSGCFSYGRRYYSYVANLRSEMAPPWFALTTSVSGGRCSNPSLACHTQTGTAGQTAANYSNPTRVAAAMNAAPDTWFSVQFYRFVTGSFQSSSFGWDCTSTDWRNHWSSNGELYCWSDLLSILDAAAAARANGVVFTGPSEVALAWGRGVSPSPSPTDPPSPTDTGSPSPTDSPTVGP